MSTVRLLTEIEPFGALYTHQQYAPGDSNRCSPQYLRHDARVFSMVILMQPLSHQRSGGGDFDGGKQKAHPRFSLHIEATPLLGLILAQGDES